MGIATKGSPMKIDSQSSILGYLSMPSGQNKDSDFDALMHSSDGDSYYWQHQHQLQRSELTFHSLAHENKKSSIMLESSQIMDKLTDSSLENLIPVYVHLNIPEEIHQPHAVIPSIIDKEVLTTLTEIMRPSGYLTEPNKIADQRVDNIEGLNPQNLSPNSFFKHYQIFINDAGVELTLNTTQLTKQQTQEVQKLIKQWLTTSGYRLQQFIINGVKQ
jgi:hypothetical protein